MKQSTPAAPNLILTGDVYWINVDEAQLKPNRFQPRIHFTDAEMDDLAASIREYGVLQPILVRPVYSDAKKTKLKWHEIVFGERRVRATRLNNTAQIRATVRDLSDVEAAEIALLENINAEALTDYEEAHGIQMLWQELEKAGIQVDVPSMAKRLKAENGTSRSHSFVRNRMNLIGLDDELLAVAKKRRGVASSLFEIAKVKDKEIKSEALELVEAGKGFRPVQEFIQKKLDAKKLARDTASTPDKETASRTADNEATGGGNMSRGRPVKGSTHKEAFETVTQSVQEIGWKLDTIDNWENLLTDSQKKKLIPTFLELAKRLEAKAT